MELHLGDPVEHLIIGDPLGKNYRGHAPGKAVRGCPMCASTGRLDANREAGTMLEKMAKALAWQIEQSVGESPAYGFGEEVCRDTARAALEALRTPSEQVSDAALDADLDIYWGYFADGRPSGPGDVFTAMIDAILNENPESP